MGTYGDPLASIIANALALPTQEIEQTATDLQTQQAKDKCDHCKLVTTERTFGRSTKSAAVSYGRSIDGSELEQDPFASVPATGAYPKFEAAHSSYTFQSQADNHTEPKMVSPSWKTQIGVPSNPAVSNCLGFFTGIHPDAQDALVNLKKQTGFVLVSKNSKASDNVANTFKLKPSESYDVDRYQTPPPKSTSRFPRFGMESAKFTTMTKSETGTGFTPLIKQSGKFSARQSLILESPSAKKSARIEQAKQAAAVQSLERPNKVAPRQKKKVTFHAFSQEQANYLLANIPNNPEYDIEVVLNTGSIQAVQTQPTARTRADGESHQVARTTVARTPAPPIIPAKEFKLFPKLPAELQLEIWKQALPGGRDIKLIVASNCTLPSYGTPIPVILHVCHISREVALKALHPSFHNAHNAKEYTFFNPRIDVLELTLPYAKHMATITTACIKASRDLTQHVRISFVIYAGMRMWLAMAELVLAAPHKAWPSIKSWHFPGLPIDESELENKDKEQVIEMRCVWLSVKRPDTVANSENDGKVRALAGKIGEKFAEGRKKWKKSEVQLGIRITYD